MIVPIKLLFTDPDNSTIGYHLNVFNQLLICECGILGNLGFECISLILVNNVMVAVETICFELKEFNNSLSSDTALEKKMKLRNILVQIQDVDR